MKGGITYQLGALSGRFFTFDKGAVISRRNLLHVVRCLYFLFVTTALFMIVLPMQSEAQKASEVIRFENNMMIIRFDKRNTDEFKELIKHFGLNEDSVWNYRNIGQLSKDGWKLVHLDKNIAEISKPADYMGTVNSGHPIYLKPDPNNIKSPGYPGSIVFGVNNFKANPTVYENKKDETVFFLKGYAKASKVFLSGNFNNWGTSATPMQRIDSGWIVTQKLRPGEFLYKFIVDGQWIHDPGNNKRENDGHSGFNSIYFHYNYVFRLKGYTNAKKVILSGSFNNWNEKELQMQRMADGWQLPVFLNEGTHSYKFIVDNEWITDPANKVVRPDGRGNFNSFMSLGDTVFFNLDGYTSANLVILSGNFNGWNSAELAMTRTKSGWQIPYVLAPGNYEYKFIMDGKWMTDPANPVSSGSGDQKNSVRVIDPNYTFVLKKYPNAKKVLLSGSFNNWPDEGYAMLKKDGVWSFPVYLAAGKYTYKFVVDGQWIIDPENELYEENEFGTGNSVLWIDPQKTLYDR